MNETKLRQTSGFRKEEKSLLSDTANSFTFSATSTTSIAKAHRQKKKHSESKKCKNK
jgi:hypothetical protein